MCWFVMEHSAVAGQPLPENVKLLRQNFGGGQPQLSDADALLHQPSPSRPVRPTPPKVVKGVSWALEEEKEDGATTDTISAESSSARSPLPPPPSPSSSSSSSWTCPECTFMNEKPESGLECEVCGAAKPVAADDNANAATDKHKTAVEDAAAMAMAMGAQADHSPLEQHKVVTFCFVFTNFQYKVLAWFAFQTQNLAGRGHRY
jgi:hypothetical protein